MKTNIVMINVDNFGFIPLMIGTICIENMETAIDIVKATNCSKTIQLKQETVSSTKEWDNF